MISKYPILKISKYRILKLLLKKSKDGRCHELIFAIMSFNTWNLNSKFQSCFRFKLFNLAKYPLAQYRAGPLLLSPHWRCCHPPPILKLDI